MSCLANQNSARQLSMCTLQPLSLTACLIASEAAASVRGPVGSTLSCATAQSGEIRSDSRIGKSQTRRKQGQPNMNDSNGEAAGNAGALTRSAVTAIIDWG